MSSFNTASVGAGYSNEIFFAVISPSLQVAIVIALRHTGRTAVAVSSLSKVNKNLQIISGLRSISSYTSQSVFSVLIQLRQNLLTSPLSQT